MQRDYSEGCGVRFQSRYPVELEGKDGPDIRPFLSGIRKEINRSIRPSDYSEGCGVRFQSRYPVELEGKVGPDIRPFLSGIRPEINLSIRLAITRCDVE